MFVVSQSVSLLLRGRERQSIMCEWRELGRSAMPPPKRSRLKEEEEEEEEEEEDCDENAVTQITSSQQSQHT